MTTTTPISLAEAQRAKEAKARSRYAERLHQLMGPESDAMLRDKAHLCRRTLRELQQICLVSGTKLVQTHGPALIEHAERLQLSEDQVKKDLSRALLLQIATSLITQTRLGRARAEVERSQQEYMEFVAIDGEFERTVREIKVRRGRLSDKNTAATQQLARLTDLQHALFEVQAESDWLSEPMNDPPPVTTPTTTSTEGEPDEPDTRPNA